MLWHELPRSERRRVSWNMRQRCRHEYQEELVSCLNVSLLQGSMCFLEFHHDDNPALFVQGYHGTSSGHDLVFPSFFGLWWVCSCTRNRSIHLFITRMTARGRPKQCLLHGQHKNSPHPPFAKVAPFKQLVVCTCICLSPLISLCLLRKSASP